MGRAAEEVEDVADAVVAWEAKGESSSTQSERVSIQRVRPVARGWRVRGKVMRMESWDGYLRRRALREWRNGRMRCGCDAVDG